MTRLVADATPVYRLLGKQMYGVPGDVATIYSDSAGTTLADIQTYPGAVAISGSTLTVDSYSRTPAFYLPAGVDTVYAKVLGGPVTPIYSRFDDRLDAISSYVINVKDIAYGALGDGSTDDSAAFTLVNTAAAAAVALKGGAKIVMPAGHYKSTVGIAALTGLTVEGDAMGGTILEITSTTASAISGADKRRVTVRDIELLGPGSGSGLGINLTYSSSAPFNCCFENVYIKAFGGDNFHAETLCASTLRNVRSENSGGKGVYMDNGTSVVMDAVYANSNSGAAGIHLKTMTYCTLNGGAADGNTIAYHLEGGGNITLNGCGTEGPATGFKVNGGTCHTINNPYVRAETSIAYWVTGSATNVILNVPREVSPGGAATASIQVDAGSRAQVTLPSVVTAVNYLGTVKRTTTTDAYFTNTASMTVTADRAANTDFASFTLARAGSDKWGFQNRSDSTDDLHIRNLVDGLTAVLVERRATAPNLSLLTSTKSYGGGVGVILIPNASTNPSTNPSSGSLVYVDGGVVKFRDSSGNVFQGAFGAVTAQTSYGASSSDGTATTGARSDHVHGTPSLTANAASTQAIGDSAAVGTGTAPARDDHKHAMPAFAIVGSSALGDAAAAGSAATIARSDHVHGRESFGAVTAVAWYDVSANGSATTPARSDHSHGLPTPSTPTPQDQGLLAWTADPFTATQNRTPAAGVMILARVKLHKAVTVTNIIVNVAVLGGTLANCYVALYDSTGVRRGVSADQSSAWTSAGTKTIALGSTYAAAAGTYYIGLLVGSAVTMPQIRGGSGNSGHATAGDSAPFRFSTTGSGLTAAPDPVTMAGVSASNDPLWFGLS